MWQSLDWILKSLSCIFWRTLESHRLSIVLTSVFFTFSSKRSSFLEYLCKNILELRASFFAYSLFHLFHFPFTWFIIESDYCGNNWDLSEQQELFTLYLLPGIRPKGREPTSEGKEERLHAKLFSTYWDDLTNFFIPLSLSFVFCTVEILIPPHWGFLWKLKDVKR